MAEVREFALPDLGEGLTEAMIVRWLVEVGEVVVIDQPVVEVETAKAMVEVPCPHAGVVTARFGEEGQDIPVGSPLVTVAVGATTGTPDQTAPQTTPGAAPEAASAAARNGGVSAPAPEEAVSSEYSGNVLVGYGTGKPAARRRRVERTAAVVARPPAPPAPRPEAPLGTGRLNGDTGHRNVPVISPLVRRLAREHQVDLTTLTGSGPDGLILRRDVEEAVRAATRPATPAEPERRPTPGEQRVPLRGALGVAAERMARSRREIPDATCWVDADATELVRVRAEMNSDPARPKVSLLALFARISTLALERYPALNATVDTERNEIVRLPGVHLGFAAQTDRGLVVPVVRDAHAMNAERLTEEMGRLTEKARSGGLGVTDLTGGTFTLNNYGVFGVDGSTPIINHPEAAMLGVGRIVDRPWAHEGELALRKVVQLSFTFDHRVCDGGTAGGFLRFVADCVERPSLLLRCL
ncbi:dihydrolipoamide acetyltransferase family protein [Streptomyces sp. NPDC005438]|uniref:dihydrolipoamide acetyltransferase family protein n=1 Tax=Streptomyces sp. NPDC005438 TaxID=3156880 RepID=UPI00339FB466